MKRKKLPRTNELRFRHPMSVSQKLAFQNGHIFPVCPQCGTTIEREYQRYCDRCGQRLDWSKWDQAAVITAPVSLR